MNPQHTALAAQQDREHVAQCEQCGLLDGWHHGWCKTGIEAWERAERGANAKLCEHGRDGAHGKEQA